MIRWLAAVLAAALLAAAPARADDVAAQPPEPGPFRLGTQPWIGYGLWAVAARNGLFDKQGLTRVDLVGFGQDKEINAALASGQLDGANVATHTAMGMIAAGLPVRIVMLLDVSTTADAVLATGDIRSVEDLRGRPVAFEQGSTSDILINRALLAHGMSIADIQPVPMPAADVGGALIAGRVLAAVTYEPYLAAVRAQGRDVRVLFTAGSEPGLISDVLIVREDVLRQRPGQVVALLKAWDAALSRYAADPDQGRAVIAEAVGSNAAELSSAFDGVKFYSLADNKAALTGSFASATVHDIADAAREAGIFATDISAAGMIDGSFVAAAF